MRQELQRALDSIVVDDTSFPLEPVNAQCLVLSQNLKDAKLEFVIPQHTPVTVLVLIKSLLPKVGLVPKPF